MDSESRFGLQVRTPDPDRIHFDGGICDLRVRLFGKIIGITDNVYFTGFVLPIDAVSLKMILTIKAATAVDR